MKKNLFLSAILLSAGSLMVACGTAETSEQAPNSSSQDQPVEETAAPETEVQTETSKESDNAENDAASEASSEDETDTESPEEPSQAETDTESLEEPSQAETEGTLTGSDEQNYEIRIVRGYELTSEEPGKDVLYLAEDSTVFMRIETFSKTDISFDQALTSMKETVQASNPNGELTETEGPTGIDFLNSAAYEIPTTEGKVTGIVFEKEELIVRLTLFDSADATATEDFIDMAKTIEPKN